nr:unnamed protein product [Spirometra erinaceieuropaei]
MNFCFKWLLILFKREFSYDDIKVLWEALWSDVVPKNFHLLVAASIFYGEMDRIMQTCEDVNQLLQLINLSLVCNRKEPRPESETVATRPAD